MILYQYPSILVINITNVIFYSFQQYLFPSLVGVSSKVTNIRRWRVAQPQRWVG